MKETIYIEGDMFNKFLKKTFNPFYKEVCTFMNKICKKIDECLGINRVSGDTELVLSQRGTWITPPISPEVTRWEYIEIPYTLFTDAATSQTVSFKILEPKQAVVSAVLNIKEIFNNTTTYTITSITTFSGTSQTLSNFAINCKVLSDIPSVSSNGNLVVRNLVNTTELRITVQSTGGNVNAATQGKINCWILTSTLP